MFKEGKEYLFTVISAEHDSIGDTQTFGGVVRKVQFPLIEIIRNHDDAVIIMNAASQNFIQAEARE
jgi:hypothetical protein